MCGVWSENLAPSATGETTRSEKASGTGVTLLFFILQEVGWFVSCHPPRVNHLEGSVSTSVVHTAQWSVPAGWHTHLMQRILHCSCYVTWNLNKRRIQQMERVDGCVLTLYHRGYSRAHITSSRTTRCHDTSSPVLEDVRFNWFVIGSWLVQSSWTHSL